MLILLGRGNMVSAKMRHEMNPTDASQDLAG
jgi:hypothetical protein